MRRELDDESNSEAQPEKTEAQLEKAKAQPEETKVSDSTKSAAKPAQNIQSNIDKIIQELNEVNDIIQRYF